MPGGVGTDENGFVAVIASNANPVTAVAWLARKVAGFGVRLEAGHVILPGSCTRAIDVRPGDDFHADFKGLGSVSLTFGSGPTEPVSDAGSDA